MTERRRETRKKRRPSPPQKRLSPLSSDFSCIARDITIDLNGYTLASDEEVDWFEGEFIKIEL